MPFKQRFPTIYSYLQPTETMAGRTPTARILCGFQLPPSAHHPTLVITAVTSVRVRKEPKVLWRKHLSMRPWIRRLRHAWSTCGSRVDCGALWTEGTGPRPSHIRPVSQTQVGILSLNEEISRFPLAARIEKRRKNQKWRVWMFLALYTYLVQQIRCRQNVPANVDKHSWESDQKARKRERHDTPALLSYNLSLLGTLCLRIKIPSSNRALCRPSSKGFLFGFSTTL